MGRSESLLMAPTDGDRGSVRRQEAFRVRDRAAEDHREDWENQGQDCGRLVINSLGREEEMVF